MVTTVISGMGLIDITVLDYTYLANLFDSYKNKEPRKIS